jgi:hypothetical protein
LLKKVNSQFEKSLYLYLPITGFEVTGITDALARKHIIEDKLKEISRDHGKKRGEHDDIDEDLVHIEENVGDDEENYLE